MAFSQRLKKHKTYFIHSPTKKEIRKCRTKRQFEIKDKKFLISHQFFDTALNELKKNGGWGASFKWKINTIEYLITVLTNHMNGAVFSGLPLIQFFITFTLINSFFICWLLCFESAPNCSPCLDNLIFIQYFFVMHWE